MPIQQQIKSELKSAVDIYGLHAVFDCLLQICNDRYLADPDLVMIDIVEELKRCRHASAYLGLSAEYLEDNEPDEIPNYRAINRRLKAAQGIKTRTRKVKPRADAA